MGHVTVLKTPKTLMDREPTLQEDYQLATFLADAVTKIPGVSLYMGPAGRIATYGPGTRIQGIRIERHDGQLDVAIEVTAAISRSGSLLKLADNLRGRIRQALRRLHGESIGIIDVRISDIDIQPS